MTKQIKIALKTILVLIVLNALYALFFYTKTYNETVVISTEIVAENPTQVWYVYKNKYSEERFFSNKKTLAPGQQENFEYQIKTTKEIDYVGLFWNAPLNSSISLCSYSFKINEQLFKEYNPINIIQYTNPQSITKSLKNGVKITSTTSKRNWVILNDTGVLNKQRDLKVFRPIPLFFNLVLLVVFYFASNKIDLFDNLKLNSDLPTIRKVRLIIFVIWIFLMPFWIIISHTLMAISAALMLYEYYVRYIRPPIDFKIYLIFFLFYIGIIFTSFFTSNINDVVDVALDYSYFLVMPLCMLGIDRDNKKQLLKWFKVGLLTYFLLLLIFTTQNYQVYQPDEDIFNFLKDNLELFWHTSYFSALLLILFISAVFKPEKKNYVDIIFYGFSLFFMYIIDARLPFIVGALLLAIRVINSLKNRRTKTIFVLFSSLTATVVFISFLGFDSQAVRGDINFIDARLSIWESSFLQIRDNLLFGVGNGNTVEAISKTIKEAYKTKYRDFNAHNQFIEICLSNGIVVFGVFILLLVQYFKNSSDYGKLFIAICVVLFMVESYLQRQAGIVFFTFWAVFFNDYFKEVDDERAII